MGAVTTVPAPRNEPVLDYAPGSLERAALQARLAELGGQTFDLTMTLGGRQRMASGGAGGGGAAAPGTPRCWE